MQFTVVKPSAVCGYGYWVSPQCVQALSVMSPRVFMRQVRMRQGAMLLSQATPKHPARGSPRFVLSLVHLSGAGCCLPVSVLHLGGLYFARSRRGSCYLAALGAVGYCPQCETPSLLGLSLVYEFAGSARSSLQSFDGAGIPRHVGGGSSSGMVAVAIGIAAKDGADVAW